MLARSIPQYEAMREACASLALRYIKRGAIIGDLGCSRGEAIAQLVDRLGATCGSSAWTSANPCCTPPASGSAVCSSTWASSTFAATICASPGLPFANASVVLAVLTIQFTPIEYRLRIIQDVFQHACAWRGVPLCGKGAGRLAEIDGHMVSLYYDLKRRNEYAGTD